MNEDREDPIEDVIDGTAREIPSKPEGEEEESIEYGFIITKTSSQFRVQPLTNQDGSPMGKALQVDDVFAACQIVSNNITVQKTADSITQGMMQVAQQAKGVSEGGIVLP